MTSRSVWLAFAALAGACATPRTEPRPQAVVVAPLAESARLEPASIDAGSDAADATSDDESNAGAEPPELPLIPPAPSKRPALDGSAAVVWIPDVQAVRGFRSVFLEEVGGLAREVRDRKEPVVVGKNELWVIRTRKLASLACSQCELCANQPPTCKVNDPVTLEVPYLQSLKSKRKLEPWKGRYSPRAGCSASVAEHDTTLQIDGAVGLVLFTTVNGWDQYCGGMHPVFWSEAVEFDVDAAANAKLTFPVEPLAALREHAKAEMTEECVLDPKEEPADYRITAAYAPNGELEGVFGFTKGAPYMCGTGPGHYSLLVEKRSEWIPKELERWGKLPAWVTQFLAKNAASHAFVIPAARARAARREFFR